VVPILRSLKANPHMDVIGENEYDRLFIVRKTREGTELKEVCY